MNLKKTVHKAACSINPLARKSLPAPGPSVALLYFSRDMEIPTDREIRQPNIVIIGAGISGIAAARKLLSAGLNNVIILEAQDRFGGRILTQKFGKMLSRFYEIILFIVNEHQFLDFEPLSCVSVHFHFAQLRLLLCVFIC